MKAILLSCKGITEECESLQDHPECSDEDLENLQTSKDSMSDFLNSLMTSAKLYASDATSQKASRVEENLKNLSYAVSDLVEFMKLFQDAYQKTARTDRASVYVGSGALRRNTTIESKPNANDEALPPMDLKDLIVHSILIQYYLEDQTDDIAYSIQDLLQAMRDGASASQISDHIHSVIEFVDNTIYETHSTFTATDEVDRTVKMDCEIILDSLENDREALLAYTKKLTSTTYDKTMTKNISNACYDVAKVLRFK
jgi:hypothetical protein